MIFFRESQMYFILFDLNEKRNHDREIMSSSDKNVLQQCATDQEIKRIK